MSDRDWQDKWRSALGSFDGARVPDTLWTSVDGALSRVWKRRRMRRRLAWGGICGVGLAAAVATTCVVVLPRTGADPAPLLVRAAAPPEPELPPLSAVPDLSVPEAVPEAVPAPARRRTEDLRASETPPSRAATAAAPSASAVSEPRPAPSPEPEQEPERRPADAVPVRPDPFADPAPSRRPAPGRRGPELRLALSNGSGSRFGSDGYGAMSGSEVAALLASPLSGSADSYSAVLLENNFRAVSTDMHHRQPLRLALTAAWETGGRLSLESGLAYSCLVSDMRSGTEDNRYEIRQTLHYLGIPLKLNLRLASLSRLDLYLSGGVTAEKCIAGRSVTSYYVGTSRIGGGAAERISEDALQWSAGLSAGLSCGLGGGFRVFAEPGLSVYFDNGSFVQNVYKDRPLNFELSVGLRYALFRRK